MRSPTQFGEMLRVSFVSIVMFGEIADRGTSQIVTPLISIFSPVGVERKFQVLMIVVLSD